MFGIGKPTPNIQNQLILAHEVKFAASIWILATDFVRISGFSSIEIICCTTWILADLLARIFARMDSPQMSAPV